MLIVFTGLPVNLLVVFCVYLKYSMAGRVAINNETPTTLLTATRNENCFCKVGNRTVGVVIKLQINLAFTP